MTVTCQILVIISTSLYRHEDFFTPRHFAKCLAYRHLLVFLTDSPTGSKDAPRELAVRSVFEARLSETRRLQGISWKKGINDVFEVRNSRFGAIDKLCVFRPGTSFAST